MKFCVMSFHGSLPQPAEMEPRPRFIIAIKSVPVHLRLLSFATTPGLSMTTTGGILIESSESPWMVLKQLQFGGYSVEDVNAMSCASEK
jgi:hypothetical protein